MHIPSLLIATPFFQLSNPSTGQLGTFLILSCPHSIFQKNLWVSSLRYICHLTTSHRTHHYCHGTHDHLLSPGLLQYPLPSTCGPYGLLSAKLPGDTFKNITQIIFFLCSKAFQWFYICLTVMAKVFTMVSKALGTSPPTVLSLVTWLSHAEPACCSWNRRGFSAEGLCATQSLASLLHLLIFPYLLPQHLSNLDTLDSLFF